MIALAARQAGSAALTVLREPDQRRQALRRMATGWPRNRVSAAPAIPPRIRENFASLPSRQASWAPARALGSGRRALCPRPDRAGGEKGRSGIGWATIRVSIEELHAMATMRRPPRLLLLWGTAWLDGGP